MGKFKMGRQDDSQEPKKQFPTDRYEPEPKIVEKIVEKVIEVPIEVEKIVEVPVYIESEKAQEMDLSDLSKIHETIAEEQQLAEQRRLEEMERLSETFKNSLDKLGESCSETFNKSFEEIQKNREALNNQGKVIVALKDVNNKQAEKISKLLKDNKKQKYINYTLAIAILITLLI